MPVLESVPAVHDHHVPVFITSDEELNNVNWDITIQEVIAHNNYTLYHFMFIANKQSYKKHIIYTELSLDSSAH